MSSNVQVDLFNKVSDGVADLYNRKAAFHRGRYKGVDRKKLNGIRCGVVFVFLIQIAIYVTYGVLNPKYNPNQSFWFVNVIYYSMWGFVASMLSIVFSMLASMNDFWYNQAYYWTETASAINIFIMFFYWLLIYPMILFVTIPQLKTAEQIILAAGVGMLVHTMPFIGCLVNLLMTDISLEKKNWKRTMIWWFPIYMVCNIYAGYNVKSGTIYEFENWQQRPWLSLLAFIILAFVQGGLFVCFANCIDRCKSKKQAIPDDEESLPKNYNPGSNSIQ